MLKNDTKGNLLHEVNIYIGGLNGENIYFGKPVLYENKTTKPLYPNEARLKDLNYFTNLYTDIVIEYITYKDGNPTKKSKIIEKYDIGKIPIMVHSNICILNNQPKDVLTEMGECPYDQGGYFIVSGREKVIISQERISTNKLFITKSKDPDYKYEALIRCTSKENILFPKTINFVMYS
jgi:DNA-directed RNA polymerase II subunit RPB2